MKSERRGLAVGRSPACTLPSPLHHYNTKASITPLTKEAYFTLHSKFQAWQRTRAATTRTAGGNGLAKKIAIAGGLISTPVIGWSLYTLKTTGCGLPPGPGGSIGALEGVSYLVTVGIVG
ncbi:hypothetical protein EZV62_001108 [Acer yangbiense]|uniref:Uncharacterized protein n=1 Tax=Acer yangbiense TaxID=1000413 RepID=A0A5C7ITT4_9ROSI|nr:hypothetical protein EZV62_001108 [Acer yangbiense]